MEAQRSPLLNTLEGGPVQLGREGAPVKYASLFISMPRLNRRKRVVSLGKYFTPIKYAPHLIGQAG